MLLYNYLFYYSYELAIRIKNERDNPLLYAIGLTGGCIVCNLLVALDLISFVFNLNISEKISGLPKYSIAIPVYLILYIYYTYINNHRKLYSKYKHLVSKPRTTTKALLIVVGSILFSFVLLIISTKLFVK